MIRICEIIRNMYVCICNAVTERQIRKAAAAGVATLHELTRVTGCADCCGTCTEHAEQVLRQAHGAQAVAPVISLPTFVGAL